MSVDRGTVDTRPLLQEEAKVPLGDDVESQETQEVDKKAATSSFLNLTPLLAEFFGTALLTATAGFNSSNSTLSGEYHRFS